MKKPKLSDYNVKALVVLGNQAYDNVLRDDIKSTLVKKYNNLNYPIMFLLHNFLYSKDILREVYAELIMIKMYNYDIFLSENVTDEVISLVSMDTLTKYGMESCSLEFREKCKNEFWNRALKVEDKAELIKKRNIDNPMKLKVLVMKKKKGDIND